jgi:ectoine hydroxylase-related dioxygenase (phytanoyl-CoA dioxygenase family)
MAAPPRSTADPRWLDDVTESLRFTGYAIVENVLPPALVERTHAAMYGVRERILAEVGTERLERAGELGVLRLMFRFDPLFFSFLEIPQLLAVVDRTVSETAVLHLQNGFILPPLPEGAPPPDLFQLRFHQDFPRVLNGYLASVNVMFAIDPFTEVNGATLLVPGTQQKLPPPDPAYLRAHAVAAECPKGSMVVFDSTLWHAAGMNRAGSDRLSINHQFTRSYLKQQIDYVRALGPEGVERQAPRTQQLLGGYTRVVTSLDEYYRPEDERLYRKGQG